MEEVLAVQNLHKRFGSGSRLVRANDGITIDVKVGEVVGVLDHNGTDKTTFINQIIGLYKPHSGSITVGGVDVVAEPELARRLVSVQAQANIPVTDISPRKAIELTGKIRGGRRWAMRARTNELVDVLDMEKWADKLTERVSGGVTRLTTFAMAVAQLGDLVVLDEPTNDVDPVRWRLLQDEIRRITEHRTAVLLVAHNVRETKRAVDSLVLLNHGKTPASGTPASVVSQFGDGVYVGIGVGRRREPAIPSAWPVEKVDPTHICVKVHESRVTDAAGWAVRAHKAKETSRYETEPVSLEGAYVALTTGDAANAEEKTA